MEICAVCVTAELSENYSFVYEELNRVHFLRQFHIAVNTACNHSNVKVQRKDGDFRGFSEYLKEGEYIHQAAIN